MAGGTYRILEAEKPSGTLIFAHGYKGSAGQVMRGRLKTFASKNALNLVALQSAGDDWAIPNAPTDGNFVPRDEVAYVKAVFDDLEMRFDLDRSSFVLAGFSAGAMLVSTVACRSELTPHAFVAIAGTAWAPMPGACVKNDTRFLHIHGLNDTVVPMAGRPVADAHQGDVRLFLKTLAASRPRHAETAFSQPVACDSFETIAGTETYLCLTRDGHGFRPDYLTVALPG